MKIGLKSFSIFALVATTLVLVNCTDDDKPLPQVVSQFTFTINQDNGTVTFINASENASEYEWDFGDDTFSTEINPIKIYVNGTYTVTLTAKNVNGSSDTSEDTFTILIPEDPALPITFDAANVRYQPTVFNGTTFEVVTNPDLSGSNDTESNVGAITNSGVAFEGFFFDLSEDVDFSMDKTISLDFWSQSQLGVLIKMEQGTAADIETTVTHPGTGWVELEFVFNSSASYSRMTLFVDGPGTTSGTFYIDNIAQIEDDTPPVITLIGEDTITVTEGSTFTDPGATATDNVDGDISDDIVVGGDTVDTDTVGSYVITYNVSDAAGNAAEEVTRTVIVRFNDGLLVNGDFEDGADPWLSGVGTDPAPVTTENNNTFYSVNITAPDPGQPFLVNLSQKLQLTQGESYILSFDAWSDRDRNIIAGLGRSGGDFAASVQTVSITDTRTTYSISITNIAFGEADNRVLFDSNGEAGLVNIDNVSLSVDPNADRTPPVITLTGDAVIDIIEGDAFADPGATATDDVDGDITDEIVVGGDTVDNATVGSYVITYNVSDAAGNAADEVTRTVNVVAFDDGLLTNGSFQAGADPWLAGVGTDPAPVTTMGGNTFYSVNITNPNPEQPFLVNLSQKLALMMGANYTLTFDAWSDRDRTIIAGLGRSGGDFASAVQSVNITATRTTYTLSFENLGFGEADNRVLFDSNGEAGLVNIDNVKLETSGGGGGNGCDATPVAATTLPLDFEGCETFLSAFSSIGDGGVVPSLVENPSKTGINTSDNVLRVVRASGINRWGGVQNSFPAGVIDITTNTFKIKVYSSMADVTYRFELALDPQTEPVTGNPAPVFRQVSGGANEWVELEFTFINLPATPTTYNQLVIKPDNPDGSDGETTMAEQVFYFDDLRLD